jgi:RNA polymerase sigma factor (sigma-70 family)
MTRWAPEDLVAGAIAGQESANEQLMAVIWPACFRLAASLIGDCALAQDAAQDACVIVHRKIRTLKNAAAFDAWMYRIVTRESSRIRRRQTADNRSAYDQGISADTTEAMDVWRALAALSPPLREVTVLFYFDDLPTDEIAGILGISHATVRTRLLRAREHLRPLLEVQQHAV